MKRRAFVLAMAGGLLAAPLGTEGQRAEKTPRVGVISERSTAAALTAAVKNRPPNE